MLTIETFLEIIWKRTMTVIIFVVTVLTPFNMITVLTPFTLTFACSTMNFHAVAWNGYLTDTSVSERMSDFRYSTNELWPWRRKLREKLYKAKVITERGEMRASLKEASDVISTSLAALQVRTYTHWHFVSCDQMPVLIIKYR